MITNYEDRETDGTYRRCHNDDKRVREGPSPPSTPVARVTGITWYQPPGRGSRWGGEYVLVRGVWHNGGVTSSVSQ